MPPTNLRALNKFAQRKAKLVTNTPVRVELGNLPQSTAKRKYDVVARGFTDTTNDGKKVIRHGVILDRRYYQQNRNNPYELRQAVSHELCHSQAPARTHGKQFRKCARKLGCDKRHQGAYW